MHSATLSLPLRFLDPTAHCKDYFHPLSNRPQDSTQLQLYHRRYHDQAPRTPCPLLVEKAALPQIPVLFQALPCKMSHNQTELPPGMGPSQSVCSEQHNCLRSCDVFLSLCNSCAAAKDPASIVCLHDSPLWRNCLFTPFSSFAPIISTYQPKVAFYILFP